VVARHPPTAGWTPDGNHLLFFGNNSNLFDPDWWITDLHGTSLQRTGLWNVIMRDHHLEVIGRAGIDVGDQVS